MSEALPGDGEGGGGLLHLVRLVLGGLGVLHLGNFHVLPHAVKLLLRLLELPHVTEGDTGSREEEMRRKRSRCRGGGRRRCRRRRRRVG